MIDEVRLTFMALRQAGALPHDELKVLRLGELEGTFLGLDDQGRPHLLLAAESTDAVLSSDIAALGVQSRVLTINGVPTTFLDIACLLESVAEVFDHFVVAVVEHLRDGTPRPEQGVSEVLEKWRQFLIAGAGPPGRDKLVAVFGELVLLLDIVRAPGGGKIDAWVGPFRGRHDLRRGQTAVEVKTTRSHTSRVITVHGEDQLLEPDDGELFLHLVRLEEVPDGGRSVSTLVDELLAAGAPAQGLFEALTAAGIPPAELAATDTVRFDVRERITFPVDDRMPRIVPASFTGGARPVGVIDLSYRINLDHVLDRALDEARYKAIIDGLAAGDVA